MRAMILALIAMLAMPAGAMAQGVAPSPIHVSAALLPGRVARRAVPPPGIAANASQKNYWLEGAIGGGILLGIGGVLFAIDLCNPDSGGGSCTSAAILGGLATATVGTVIGAFVGKAIPKR